MTTRTIDRIHFVTRHFNELQGLRTAPLGLILVCLGIVGFYLSLPLLALLEIGVSLGGLVLILRIGPYYQRVFGEVEQQPALVDAGLLSVYSPAGPAPLATVRRPMKPPLILIALAFTLFLVLQVTLPAATLVSDGSGIDPWVQLHTPVVFIDAAPRLPRWGDDLKQVLGQGLYVLFGAAFLGIWISRERRLSQSYYLAFGVPLLALGLLGASLGVVVPSFPVLPRTLSFFLPALAHAWMAEILCGSAMFVAGLLDHLQIVRILRPVREATA
jgi:hypothetical protein